MLQLAPEASAADLTGQPCAICGKPGGGLFGLRVPGRWSELPERFRRYLWHCADAPCVTAAEARRAKALGFAPAPPSDLPPRKPPAQPGLFGD
jgi:hypothetical protein